jgi:hypothetical protein
VFDQPEATMADSWHLNGQVLIACNCDWGCPCNFNAPPTTGKCEGGWSWHIEDGAFSDVRLDGLNFSLFAKWPGAIHEGNGEAVILIDERANAEQRARIETLVGGKVGGPWGVLGWTWPTIHGPYAASYDVQFDGINTRITCGDHFHVQGGAIRNPVSGVEVHPGVVLPEGIILKRGDLGTTTQFRVSHGVEYDHTGKYLAVGPFQYAWP